RSVEEGVEHLGIEPADSRLLGRESVVPPYCFRRRLREVRQPLVPASCRNDTETCGARPVDEIADERGLVAEGETVDDARLRRLAGQERATERVCFDGDVDDVFAVAECFQAMLDCSDRITGAFDDNVDLRVCDQRLPVLAEMRRTARQSLVDRARCEALRLPADSLEVRTRLRRREIG